MKYTVTTLFALGFLLAGAAQAEIHMDMDMDHAVDEMMTEAVMNGDVPPPPCTPEAFEEDMDMDDMAQDDMAFPCSEDIPEADKMLDGDMDEYSPEGDHAE